MMTLIDQKIKADTLKKGPYEDACNIASAIQKALKQEQKPAPRP